jgi:hypothetical protein
VRGARLIIQPRFLQRVVAVSFALTLPLFQRAYAAPISARHVPSVIARLGLQPTGRVPANTTLHLALGLPLRNLEALTNLLHDLYDPASPSFHHYLTPEQFAQAYGPAESDYEALASFARSNRLTVTQTHPNRTLLDVSGSVADIERAFHVRMLVYQHPFESRTFYAPDTEPTLDLDLPVLSIEGLNNYTLPRPLFRRHPPGGLTPGQAFAGSAPGGSYMGYDFRSAYAPDVTLDGAGQSVALFECDGYNATDIAQYVTQAGLPAVTLTNVLVDGFSGLAGSGNVEVALDIEMANSMAPGLSQIIVYEVGSDNTANDTDLLNRIANDDLAAQISSSWIINDSPQYAQIYQQFAAQGQSFFQASGDEGAYGPNTFQQEDSPLVTLVGGTTLTTTGPGGAYVSDTVWNWAVEYGPEHTGSASGGGISTNYPVPYWQQPVDMSTNQGSASMRDVPDVALTADNVFVVADDGESLTNIGGTSCAAPLWAAFTALANEQSAGLDLPPAGFLNPALYTIGLSTNYTSCFHDVTTGNNTNRVNPTKYFAVPGYDLCTGWGTPAGQALINSLTGTLVPGPPSVISQPQSQTVPTGTTVTLAAGVNGSLPFSFQWSWNGTNIPGATNGGIVLSDIQTIQAGTYAVAITNALGWTLSSNAVLTVLPPAPPVVTAQPASQVAGIGGQATFQVAASGTPPLGYQWMFFGTNLPNATNSSLLLPSVQLSQAGTYCAQVASPYGTNVSSNAMLVVYPSWSASGSTNRMWTSVACSADGTHVVASSGGLLSGLIYTSADSGATWQKTTAPSNSWTSVASSTDGSRLVAIIAAAGGFDDPDIKGFVYTSTNHGTNWLNVWTNSSRALRPIWSAVASSADGTRLVAAAAGFVMMNVGTANAKGLIFTSANSGNSWTQTLAPTNEWISAACSADGSVIVAAVSNGLIYASEDSGNSWNPTGAPSSQWTRVATSSDGSIFVAVSAEALHEAIYVSSNSGLSWTQTSAPSLSWRTVSSSADGSRLVAAAATGQIYVSTNSGSSWWDIGSPNLDWTSTASSADGSLLFAAPGGENQTAQIYSWQAAPTLKITPAPNELLLSWPTSWTGALLLQSPELSGSNWSSVTNASIYTNGQVSLPAPSTAGAMYFRLSYP